MNTVSMWRCVCVCLSNCVCMTTLARLCSDVIPVWARDLSAGGTSDLKRAQQGDIRLLRETPCHLIHVCARTPAAAPHHISHALCMSHILRTQSATTHNVTRRDEKSSLAAEPPRDGSLWLLQYHIKVRRHPRHKQALSHVRKLETLTEESLCATA